MRRIFLDMALFHQLRLQHLEQSFKALTLASNASTSIRTDLSCFHFIIKVSIPLETCLLQDILLGRFVVRGGVNLQ